MLAFGKTIKEKRESFGWTQKQLASKLYVSDKTVSRWENDQIYPDIVMLLGLCKVLEINYQELIEGSDYIQRQQALKKKRQKMIKWSFISIIVVGICFFGLSFYNNKQSNVELQGIDYVASKQWTNNSVGYDSIVQYDHNIYSDYKKQQFLDLLHIDEWYETDETINLGSIFLGFEEGRVNLQLEEKNDYTLIYDMKKNQTYRYDGLINGQELQNKHRDFPQIIFNYNHRINNQSEFVLLTEQEAQETKIKNTFYELDLKQPKNGGSFNATFLGIGDDMDEINVQVHQYEDINKTYLAIASQAYDIQEISNQRSDVYLKGTSRLFSRPYILIFDVSELNVKDMNVYYNDELVYPFW